MSTQRNEPTGLTEGACELVTNHAEAITELAELGTYRLADLADDHPARDVHKRLVRRGAIDIVDTVNPEEYRNPRTVNVYEVRRPAAELARDTAARRPSLPCGPDHTGFVTVADGYECSDCGDQYTREEIVEYLFDEEAP